jgi:hypothetical protein
MKMFWNEMVVMFAQLCIYTKTQGEVEFKGGISWNSEYKLYSNYFFLLGFLLFV